jgi:hypothetical protein
MNPLLVVAIPLGLVILGMVFNSIGGAYDQPSSSPEQDPIKRLTADKEAYRKAFELQRGRSIKRQKRVGQYCWLLIISFIGAFIWLYFDTVNKTIASTQVAAMRTLATEEGKQMVLSMTLTDGSTTKYLIKMSERVVEPRVTTASTAPTEVAVEKISNWELERLGTALSFGDNPLPLGIALKISKLATDVK